MTNNAQNIGISALKIITSTDEEINILNNLGEEYKEYSEMSDQDRAFLNTLVLRKQPLRLLELGVSKGASSIIILNAIKDIQGAHLYSIDYNTQHYRLKDKLTGFYVDNFPELKEKWTLKTGGLALNFMDEIGGDIDFCLLDTAHCNPGEILDFLMILPYLSKNATIVFHDTNLHTNLNPKAKRNLVNWEFTNNILMSTITGNKLLPDNKINSNFDFCNIGAIELNENTLTHVWEIFNLLTIKWVYIPKTEDVEQLIIFFKKFYGEYYADYFKRVIEHQKKIRLLEEQLKRNEIKTVKPIPQTSSIQKSIQNIFSVKNEDNHKTLRILGIKIKFKNKGV